MKRKGLILAGVMMLLLAAGCSGKKGEELSSAAADLPVTAQRQEDTESRDQPLGDDAQDAAGGEAGNESNAGGDNSADESDEGNSSAGTAAVQGTMELLGNVVSIGDNSVVISQTFTEELEDGEAEIAWGPAEGSQDEVLVNVIFTADTQYEYKTVKNSGINPEDIEVRAGNFSDIKEGLSLDMTGSYQRNDFYAAKVSISEFVR